MTILPVGMVVQTAHHHRTAGGAACRCRKSVKEDGAVFCQSIDRRCLGDWVAVTSKGRRFIVRDKENDILLGSKRTKGNKRKQNDNL